MIPAILSFGVNLPPVAEKLGLPSRLAGLSLWTTVVVILFLLYYRKNYVIQCVAVVTLLIWLFLRSTGWLLDSPYLKTYAPPPRIEGQATPT